MKKVPIKINQSSDDQMLKLMAGFGNAKWRLLAASLLIMTGQKAPTE